MDSCVVGLIEISHSSPEAADAPAGSRTGGDVTLDQMFHRLAPSAPSSQRSPAASRLAGRVISAQSRFSIGLAGPLASAIFSSPPQLAADLSALATQLDDLLRRTRRRLRLQGGSTTLNR